jgi:PadR family transcriptional regulator PadR
MDNELLQNTMLELRRGVIVMAVLSRLDEEQYGYSLLKLLADQGLELDQGTLYPLLRRLESQGLLQSVWRLEEARPRRYYVISPEGQKILPQLKQEWTGIVAMMEKMLTPGPSEAAVSTEKGRKIS